MSANLPRRNAKHFCRPEFRPLLDTEWKVPFTGRIHGDDSPKCVLRFVPFCIYACLRRFDISWKLTILLPSETGGLFRLLARLMAQKSPVLSHRYVQQSPDAGTYLADTKASGRNISLESFTTKLGEYFQIRDDYKNLTEEVRPSPGA